MSQELLFKLRPEALERESRSTVAAQVELLRQWSAMLERPGLTTDELEALAMEVKMSSAWLVVALVEIVRLGFLIQVAVLYMAALVVALGAEQLLVTQQFQVQQAEICPRKVVVGDQGVQLTQMVQMEQRNQTLGERALVAADLLLQARLAPAAMV